MSFEYFGEMDSRPWEKLRVSLSQIKHYIQDEAESKVRNL